MHLSIVQLRGCLPPAEAGCSNARPDPDDHLTPTITELPPTLGQFGATPDNPLAGLFRSSPFASFNAPFNTTGQPAMSVPLHMSSAGLPIGMQFVAAPAREDVLFRLAAQLERAAPWADRRPPIWAGT